VSYSQQDFLIAINNNEILFLETNKILLKNKFFLNLKFKNYYLGTRYLKYTKTMNY
jgi:hypothetical protein